MLVEFTLTIVSQEGDVFEIIGDDQKFTRVKNLSKYAAEQVLRSVEYYYTFEWGFIEIIVRPVTIQQAIKSREDSDGFAGFDWAIDSIIENGMIIEKEIV